MQASSSVEWSAAPRHDNTDKLEAGGLPAWLAALLARRGVKTPAEAQAFLEPELSHLIDPRRLDGMEAATERLLAARQRDERVAIVGDYDVDGVSATALLAAVFKACRLEVVTILPHRLREGYGFQPTHVEAAALQGCRVIVTADCGSSSYDAADEALKRGIDLIVSDHHLTGRRLPARVIEINPKREGSSYPFPDLSGAGLAFKLATSLAERAERQIETAALLRIACLGTICDLVPLVGENRVIAALGLAALPETRSPGLRALIRRTGLRPPFDASDVGFRLGPRLNAAGRVSEPQQALDLLMTRDAEEARRLAETLEACNRERQAAEALVVDEARERLSQLDPLPRLLVEWDERWHQGVVGIAASRIAREFHRPAILLSVDGVSATGSGRSIRGIDLHRFLAQWSEELSRFGGHARAVGLSVATDQLEHLRQAWCEAAAEWDDELLRRRLEYELAPRPEEVNAELLADLQRLAPFGPGNQQPLLRVGRLRLAGKPRRFGRLDTHAAASSRSSDGHQVELLGWGWGERLGQLTDWFEVLGHLELDRYRNAPVLRLVDARPSTRKMALDG